nr:hypothetical protein [Tanacetum cinerariifolium]GFC99122.1 hypothetical protein [Tanacetum cinerariifolium]
MALLVVLFEADETLELALAAYGRQMVECKNLSPQQPLQTHTHESWPEFQADNEKQN